MRSRTLAKYAPLLAVLVVVVALVALVAWGIYLESTP